MPHRDDETIGLKDDQLERDLIRAEERAMAAEERAQGPPPKRPWNAKRACSWILPVFIVALGAVALWFSLQKPSDEEKPTSAQEAAHFFVADDPWEGIDQHTIAHWKNEGGGNGNGLHWDVVDALSSTGGWEDIFHAVLKQYEEGSPKSLIVSTEKGGYDSDCEPVDNKSKFCNGNYGDTKWRGITLHLVQDGFLIATTSKMNDFYLSSSAGASLAEKRYTMCHELGHSLGLAHADEDYYNVDLGNCMDYTTNWSTNQQPDHTNFDALQNLYGTVPGTSVRKRKLRNREEESATTIPDSIRAQLQDATRQLLAGRRFLQSRTDTNETREYDQVSLGNGWSLRVHKLLV